MLNLWGKKYLFIIFKTTTRICLLLTKKLLFDYLAIIRVQ